MTRYALTPALLSGSSSERFLAGGGRRRRARGRGRVRA